MKSGVFTMSMKDYLAAPGLSQSQLKPMGRSPAHFKAALEEPEESTADQILGSIIHLGVLEPHLLANSYHVRPETYVDLKTGDTKPWHGGANACKDWLAAHEDRPVIRQHEHEAVIAIRKTVHEHPAARAALSEGLAEQSLFVEDPETGAWLKHRPDWMSGNCLINLKSTEDASKEGFAWSIEKFSYDSAAAFHLDVANWLGLKKNFYLFIAVEKNPPYAVGVYELGEKLIEEGRQKYRRWLSLYDYCQRMDEWPAYSVDIEKINSRAWELRRENQLLLA